MINGIKPSELDVRNRSLHIHYGKLSQISTGQNHAISTFNTNFHTIVRKKKYNHVLFINNFRSNGNISNLIVFFIHYFRGTR